MSDHILVLNEGQWIVEDSHEEPMDLSGYYASTFNIQAERYE